MFQAGADVNAGRPVTPLVIAAANGLTDCVNFLLEMGQILTDKLFRPVYTSFSVAHSVRARRYPLGTNRTQNGPDLTETSFAPMPRSAAQ
jgi:hypothetical protein